jgi:glycosyltransferase involved in cell wall biosynthesis
MIVGSELHMMSGEPVVSVVIPTVSRQQLVMRAVRSALAQTLKSVEVLVAIDGLDEATRDVLATADEPRLLVKTLPRNGGAKIVMQSVKVVEWVF